MRLPSYRTPSRRPQRAFVRITSALGGELDDVGKTAMRRPAFFGRPFLDLAQQLLRGGPSPWSVGEREHFAAAVSRANSCAFCVGTHGEIAARELGDDDVSPPAAAVAAFLEALTLDPDGVGPADVEQVRTAGVADDALAEAVYVAFMFNFINRVADALEFEHRSDRDRRNGARALRRLGYRLPPFLLR
jgi:uncharacterized peroxidase-related enzyme